MPDYYGLPEHWTETQRNKWATFYDSAQKYITRVCAAEYAAHIRAYPNPRRRPPIVYSDYVASLCRARDDYEEESFKALKMLEGYASALGV